MFSWFKRKKSIASTTAEPAPAAFNPDPAPAAKESTPTARAPEPAPQAGTRQTTPKIDSARRRLIRAQGPRILKSDLAYDFDEPRPKVGATAVEIDGRLRRSALITRVHPNGRHVVARIKTTGQGNTYVLRADGTYRLAGRAQAPRLVIGMI